jgi:hypothetical protein
MKFGLHLDHYIMLTEILMRIHLQWHTEMSLNIHVNLNRSTTLRKTQPFL